MQCPMQECDFEGTLREVERHRHTVHGTPRWDTVHELPPGEPEAELP